MGEIMEEVFEMFKYGKLEKEIDGRLGSCYSSSDSS